MVHSPLSDDATTSRRMVWNERKASEYSNSTDSFIVLRLGLQYYLCCKKKAKKADYFCIRGISTSKERLPLQTHSQPATELVGGFSLSLSVSPLSGQFASAISFLRQIPNKHCEQNAITREEDVLGHNKSR